MKKKTFIVQLLDSKKPSRTSFTQVEDALFYSNDTDASLVFIPHEDTFDFESAKVVMFNRGDESLVERGMEVTTEDGRKVASYELPDEIISHWGEWVAQPVFISGGEIYSGAIVTFSVGRYLMHDRPPTLRDIIKVDELYSQLVTVMDEIAGKDVISAPEIILARGGFDTLGERLEDTDAQLAQIENGYSLPEIEEARGGENTLGERLDKEYNEVTAQLAQTRNQMILTPDHFDGTDVQKIQQALDYAISEDVHFISLNRTYDLTGESVFMPTENFWGRVVFRGGKIIKNDSGFMIDREASTKISHAPQFDGTLFESTVDGVYVFNGEGLLRYEMNSCKFIRVGLVHTTKYIQTLRLHQCETGLLGCHFIHANNGYDVEISHHRGEQSSSEYQFLKMVTNTPNGISYFGLRILSSVIEGYTNTHPIEIGAGYGVSIRDNYFEKNKGSVRIIKGGGTNRIQGIIEGNVFAANLDVYDVFVDTSLFAQRLTLKNNTATNDTGGKYLSSRVLGTRNDMETNNLPMLHNVSYYPENLDAIEENTSYVVTMHDIPDSDRGVVFEIPLQQGTGITNYTELQYLVNIKGQYGNNAIYRGHLTGILTIDIHQEDGAKAVLNFDVLSTRNTNNSTNGNLDAEPVFNYYFKETGTKQTAYNAGDSIVCIEMPNFVNQRHTTCTFKGLDSLIQQQNVRS